MDRLVRLASGITVPQSLLGVVAILGAYIASYQLSLYLGYSPLFLYIPTAVSVAVLFFIGGRYWPAVYLGGLLGSLLADWSTLATVLVPLAQALQAGLAAFLLRILRIDPIFRKFDDMLTLIFVVSVTSVIAPTISLVLTHIAGTPLTLERWALHYTSSIFNLIILTPFLLRWTAKRRFSRSPRELLETVVAFSFLVILNCFIFIVGIPSVADIPLIYFLLIPLFWIALRLRPRFVSLAFVLTSVIAITGLYENNAVDQLFQMQCLLIVLTVMFYLIVSLEEDRRLNSNLMRSQLLTLENAVSRITSESKAKNDFIAVLAHELRNPLAPVVSGIDLLKLKEGRDADEVETLNIMEDRMQVVRRLLEDLLDISRISENKLEVASETVPLADAIERAVLSTEHHRTERHQSLAVKQPKKKIYVEGDAMRLEQIFSNLLTNASKYSPSGEHISLTVTTDDSMVHVAVADRGIGLEKDSLDKIFTAFHQVETNKRSLVGLGIGLALVRSFVELHGGFVVVESEGLGKGSTFTVSLPLAGTPRRAPRASADTLIQPRAKRVLIVDDNDVAAAAIGRLLERQGCTVDFAYTASQAYDKLPEFSPDTIILDLDLPDQSGYVAAERLRHEGFDGRLIALTGLSPHDARSRELRDLFDAYLIKPVSNTELTKALLHAK